MLLKGILLCELAAFTLALSMNLQRFALSVSDEWFADKKWRTRNSLWTLGLLLYALANGFYVCALSFAPLALMSALFATVLVFNALLAQMLRREELSLHDFVGLSIIVVGVAACGYAGPSDSCVYSVETIESLFKAPSGIAYLCATSSVIVIAIVIVVRFEGLHHRFGTLYRVDSEDSDAEGQNKGTPSFYDLTERPTVGQGISARILSLSDNQAVVEIDVTDRCVSPQTRQLMTLVYPTVLALFESLVQVFLKALSSILLLHFNEVQGTAQELAELQPESCPANPSHDPARKSQVQDMRFWAVVVMLLFCTTMVVYWLRKVRFLG
jgi:uncharacterized membrane protein